MLDIVFIIVLVFLSSVPYFTSSSSTYFSTVTASAACKPVENDATFLFLFEELFGF